MPVGALCGHGGCVRAAGVAVSAGRVRNTLGSGLVVLGPEPPGNGGFGQVHERTGCPITFWFFLWANACLIQNLRILVLIYCVALMCLRAYGVGKVPIK